MQLKIGLIATGYLSFHANTTVGITDQRIGFKSLIMLAQGYTSPRDTHDWVLAIPRHETGTRHGNIRVLVRLAGRLAVQTW